MIYPLLSFTFSLWFSLSKGISWDSENGWGEIYSSPLDSSCYWISLSAFNSSESWGLKPPQWVKPPEPRLPVAPLLQSAPVQDLSRKAVTIGYRWWDTQPIAWQRSEVSSVTKGHHIRASWSAGGFSTGGIDGSQSTSRSSPCLRGEGGGGSRGNG